MYETFFGLQRRPFLAVPDTELFFSTPSLEESRQNVERTVRRGEGISLLVAPSGTGKTLLLRMLRKSLSVEYTVSHLLNGRLETPKAFLQQLLFDLRLPFSNADETELRLSLLDFARQESTPGIALLIDDAQHLGHPVFEEIRQLMNCDDGAAPFFRTVLAGTSELEEKLTDPSLEPFNQRIVCRSYLETFNREETVGYISWQTNLSRLCKRENGEFEQGLIDYINNSGQPGDVRRLDAPHGGKGEPIFTDGAKFLVHKLTDGLPRLINQVCDASLLLAAEKVLQKVDESIVQSAWTQLQQISKDVADAVSPISRTETTDDPETETLDERIARKKTTFKLKKFDTSIEFGTLDESDHSKNGTIGNRLPVGYKPPYPGDDESDSELEAAMESTTMNLIVTSAEADCLVDAVDLELLFASNRPLPVERPCSFDLEDAVGDMIAGRIISEQSTDQPETTEEIVAEAEPETVEELVAEAIPMPVRSRIPRPVRQRRIEPDVPRKYKRNENIVLKNGSLALTYRIFISKSEPWIGNVATRILSIPVHCCACSTPQEIINEAIDGEAPPMDQQTLEEYGREVLQGRPAFVRREPHYAYQTTEETPVRYPHPYYDLPLCWSTPQLRGEFGFGTSYSEFLNRDGEGFVVALPIIPASAANVPETAAMLPQVPESPIVRLTLGSAMIVASSTRTILEERFEETEFVGKRAVPLEEIYRPKKEDRPSAPVPHFVGVDENALTQRIESIVLRLSQAAEKIEQSATASEDSGRRALQSVELTEEMNRQFRQATAAAENSVQKFVAVAEESEESGRKFRQATASTDESAQLFRAVVETTDESGRKLQHAVATVDESVQLFQIVAESSEAAGQKLQQATATADESVQLFRQAAAASEESGVLVRRAAEALDAEVRGSLPSYKELFQELASFHRGLADEMSELRTRNEELAELQYSQVLQFQEVQRPGKTSRLGTPQQHFEIDPGKVDAKMLFQ